MCYKHNEIPGTGCGCGLWGSLIASIPLTYIHDQNQVLGVVELWGRIVRHTHGYRGQFGRPVALVSYPGQDLNELSAVYDLPVLPSIEATNAEFKLGGGMVVPNPSRHRAQPHFDWFKVLEFP
jgi:hypothetical protein